MRFPLFLIPFFLSLLLVGCGGGGGGGGGSDAPLEMPSGYVTQLGGETTSSGRPPAIAALPDGGSIVVGTFTERGLFGLGEANETIRNLAPQSGSAAYIVRLDPAGNVVWTRTLDGFDDDAIVSVSAAPSGDFAVAGYVYGSLILGFGEPNETTLAADDGALFVAQYDVHGSLRWARQVNGGVGDGRPVVAMDPLRDQVYMSFPLDRPVVLGANEPRQVAHIPTVNTDWVLAAFARDGQLVWSRQGYSARETHITALHSTDADVIAVGAFGLSLALSANDPNEPRLFAGNALFHGFALRFDGYAGETLWVRRAGAGTLVAPGDVHSNERGDIVIGGLFGGSATFGIGEANETELDADGALNGFLARMDAFGNLTWARRFVTGGSSASAAVRLEPEGDALVAIGISDTAVFDPGLLNERRLEPDGIDFVIARFADNGKVTDAVLHGGPGLQSVADMDLIDGGMLIVGGFEDVAEIGGGTPDDVLLATPPANFVARLDPDGRR